MRRWMTRILALMAMRKPTVRPSTRRPRTISSRRLTRASGIGCPSCAPIGVAQCHDKACAESPRHRRQQISRTGTRRRPYERCWTRDRRSAPRRPDAHPRGDADRPALLRRAHVPVHGRPLGADLWRRVQRRQRRSPVARRFRPRWRDDPPGRGHRHRSRLPPLRQRCGHSTSSTASSVPRLAR